MINIRLWCLLLLFSSSVKSERDKRGEYEEEGPEVETISDVMSGLNISVVWPEPGNDTLYDFLAIYANGSSGELTKNRQGWVQYKDCNIVSIHIGCQIGNLTMGKTIIDADQTILGDHPPPPEVQLPHATKYGVQFPVKSSPWFSPLDTFYVLDEKFGSKRRVVNQRINLYQCSIQLIQVASIDVCGRSSVTQDIPSSMELKCLPPPKMEVNWDLLSGLSVRVTDPLPDNRTIYVFKFKASDGSKLYQVRNRKGEAKISDCRVASIDVWYKSTTSRSTLATLDTSKVSLACHEKRLVLSWKPIDRNGHLPPEAFDAGSTTYVCRIDESEVGMVDMESRQCLIAFDRMIYPYRDYEVLCHNQHSQPKEGYEWVWNRYDNLPENAFVGGKTEDGEPIGVGRLGLDDGSYVVGKTMFGVASFVIRGDTYDTQEFEVLTLTPKRLGPG